MKKILILMIGAAVGFAQAAGVGWKNVGAEDQLGGRKTSEGYLQGKVVLVCRQSDLMQRLETVWQSFKKKPLVIIGACDTKDPACTFPMYKGAGLSSGEPATPIYVVGATGKVVYKGADDRLATEAIVSALTDLESPRSLVQWKEFLDFELENLPAHAYLRVAAFKKKFPSAAKEYDSKVIELRKIKNVDKIAKLVSLAKSAKDVRDFGPKKKMLQAKFAKTVKDSISKNASLVAACEDARLQQEAKNALADLKWAAAEL